MQKTDSKTLLKYMNLLTERVEEKIQKDLPRSFALVIDGWSANRYHYVACFAFYGDKKVLLGLSVLTMEHANIAREEENENGENEEEVDEDIRLIDILMDNDNGIDGSSMKFCARTYLVYLREILEFYKRSLQNITVLIGDNCSTNKRLARLIGCKFIGCFSHRLNLAVKLYLKQHAVLLDKLDKLMHRLRTPKYSALLRDITDIEPQTANETRWSGIYNMLRSYEKIHDYLDLRDRALRDYLPNDEEHAALLSLLPHLENMNKITKYLQKSDIKFCDVRHK